VIARGENLAASFDSADVEMIVMTCDTSTTSTVGSASNAMPGSLCRLGPAQLTGDARSDQIGSIRMLSPAVWISQLA